MNSFVLVNLTFCQCIPATLSCNLKVSFLRFIFVSMEMYVLYLLLPDIILMTNCINHTIDTKCGSCVLCCIIYRN